MAVLTWHPLAEKFPLLEGDELESLKASIRSTKGVDEQPVLYRMKDGKPQGLDGRNRHRACKELKIKCKMKRVSVPDEEVRDFIFRRNLHRRHLTVELRKALVAELLAEGESTRTIAEALGVSKTTVQNVKEEIQESGGQNCTPETVTGSDGKSYPPTKPPRKPKQHELIPELAARIGFSVTPKLAERMKLLDTADQESVNASIEMKMNPLKAVEQVEARNATPDREPGDDTEEEEAAAEWAWNAFDSSFDSINEMVDVLGSFYRSPRAPAIRDLHGALQQFKKDFRKVQKQLADGKGDEASTVSRNGFQPPTVEEVAAYCAERKNKIDPETFVDFYTTNGWVQGKNKPVKDWKACVRTWENNGFVRAKGQRKDDLYAGIQEWLNR